MYAGHVGIALALRAERDAPPLWLLALAAQGPDWVEVLCGVVGYRWLNPAWSPHGFVWLACGTALVAVVAAVLARRHGGRAAPAALLAALAYLSHWPADYFTGLKPTWPGGPLVGLGWYGRPPRDLALESAVVLVGWWAWRRALPGGAGRARALAWALLAALVALQAAGDVVMARSIPWP